MMIDPETVEAKTVSSCPAGSGDGHRMINRGQEPAPYLEVGDRAPGDAVSCPDIDLALADNDSDDFTNKDGTPYR